MFAYLLIKDFEIQERIFSIASCALFQYPPGSVEVLRLQIDLQATELKLWLPRELPDTNFPKRQARIYEVSFGSRGF